MTREEAKEVFINRGYVNVKDGIIFDGNKWRQSVEVITEWLKEQPCEDAISRSDAIRVASGYCHWSNIPKELAKLPSVNPIPCEDAISRQAVLDGLASIAKAKAKSDAQKSMMGRMMFFVEQLPSVSTEKTGRWIPVSERLPKTDGRFLAYIENPYDSQLSYMMVCDYISNTWCPDDETASSNVVAWMPLPQPYKVESEE